MSDPVKLLVVDDDEAIRNFFTQVFGDDGFEVTTLDNGEDAARAITRGRFDMVVTDLCMPRMDGLRLLEEIRERAPGTTVIAITGYGTIRDAVSLMKSGAFDVLTKPFSLDEIRMTVDRAVLHHHLRARNRELENRLEVTEKLAAIGTLAAGVAHEINNPLDGIIRFVNLTLEHLEDPATIRDYLSDARTGLDRIAGIVRSLLEFSRDIVLETDPRPLENLVRDALNEAREGRATDRLHVEVSVAAPQRPVPGALLHVFANLARNAFDAMNDDGVLRVRAEHHGDALEIVFADTGPGVPAAVRHRIFDPFFTTKPPGRGTGLGLAVCQQIVEKEGGTLTLVDRPDAGAEFLVSLPMAALAMVAVPDAEDTDESHDAPPPDAAA
jgi:signal transduction histidine kinase